MDVNFLTGDELNDAVGSYSRYRMYGHYAVIFFREGQAAVIEIKTSLYGCGMKFTPSCFPTYGKMRGQDQDGTEWEICSGQFC